MKRKRSFGRAGAALLVAAVAVACGEEGGSGAGGGAGGSGGVGGGAGCPVGTAAENGFCVLAGEITRDLHLTADHEYVLRGGVFIGDDVNETVLTIDPGTTIYGETATKGMLVIRRGSKIIAEGTREAPVVFTSPNLPGSRARGDWGGLVINGRAPVNGCAEAPCEAEGEGGTGKYGGDDPDDDSGVLKYVRVEFAGILLSEDNELNGIAFQGVGRGTEVDYVQVHMNKDDGVEFFGGTVDVRHVVLTGIGDDSLDWTDGWTGRAQYVVALQFDDAGDQGIEADNNGENNAATPRSHPKLANLTLIGSGGESSDIGVLLREGTAGNIYNSVIARFGEACLAIDHAETFAHAADGNGGLSGALTVEGTILHCPDSSPFLEPKAEDVPGRPFTVEDFFTTLNPGNRLADPGLKDAANIQAPDFRPRAGAAAAEGAVTVPDPWFEATDYVGAFGPGDDWTAGWTTFRRD